MRHLLFFLILILAATTTFAMQGPQVMFDQANKILENGDYPSALESYRNIEQMGEVSGALYLNMGIAALQIDSLGLAKYYFLKSADFSTTQESAKLAIQYVESQFSRQSAMLPKLPWDNAVDTLKEGPGATGVFVVGFILILISTGIIILGWFGRITLIKQSTTITLATLASILVVALAFYVDYIDQRYHEGVVIAKEIPVTQQPNETSDLVSLAYEGYTVTIDQFESKKNEGWYYIRLGNGQFGWIKPEGAKIL